MGSDPFDADFSEEAVGPDHEDQHEGDEWRNLLDASAEDGIEIAAGEVLQDADEEAAEDGPAHAVEAPDDPYCEAAEPEDGERRVHAAGAGGDTRPADASR